MNVVVSWGVVALAAFAIAVVVYLIYGTSWEPREPVGYRGKGGPRWLKSCRRQT